MALYNITLSDITAENIRRVFFSCEGRLNRRRYIERVLAVSILALVFALAFYYIVISTTGDKTLAMGVTASVSVLETVAVYTLVVRRLHDLGYGKTVGVVYLIYGLGRASLVASSRDSSRTARRSSPMSSSALLRWFSKSVSWLCEACREITSTVKILWRAVPPKEYCFISSPPPKILSVALDLFSKEIQRIRANSRAIHFISAAEFIEMVLAERCIPPDS